MKQHTKEAIEAAVRDIWKRPSDDAWGWNEPDTIKVEILPCGWVEIEFESMYEAPSLNLPLLMALAEFFGTKNINDDDRFAHSGCETCGWGSSYGFTLTVRPEKEAA